MNDPYMPIEQKTGITRKALEILAENKFPVHVMTKGDIVVRDRDVLKDISSVYAAVSFTVTTADDTLAAKLEPGAPSPSARFTAMEQLAAEGIYTGITMMPILPFINDTTDNVRGIMERAASAGAYYVIPMFGVTLREGSREYHYSALDQLFPGVRERYENRFGESYMCNSPGYADLLDTFRETGDRLGLKDGMEFYSPPADTQTKLF